MDSNKAYRIVSCGNKSSRRDYSKVSGNLELPNLVEIQTDSFEWFTRHGIQEVFEEIYPIENYGKNIKLNFLRYHFDEPKYNAEESMYRECNYAAPLYADMELEITDPETGEVRTKQEEVYLGDFPLMTETGTFIINGAERVIVSQIVRSPGAYFSEVYDEKTGKQNYNCELIPSRGTWLEFMTEQKKTMAGRTINVSIDRRRKILFSIFFKALGMSFGIEKNEDAFDTKDLSKFLASIGRHVEDPAVDEEDREYMNMYLMLYNGFFGKYEEIENTLLNDKVKTTEEALLSFYENQRSDEIPTLDGSISLMQAKFFDHRRYDLTKAGRYKLRKKLNAYARMMNNTLAYDIVDVDGNVVMEKGTHVHRDERNKLRDVLAKGGYMNPYPFRSEFHEEDIVTIPTSYNAGLVGRVLARDVEVDGVLYEQGTVLTQNDVDAIRALAGTAYTFSDLRTNNQSTLGANYSFKLFLYGFLFLIAMVTVCNIINCVAMSVEARMKQYGGLRAIGLSDRQLQKMIVAETLTYAVTGGTCGVILGLLLNKKLFEFLVTYRWGEPWSLPFSELGIILGIVVLAVLLAVRAPIQKIHAMSIVDTINAQ